MNSTQKFRKTPKGVLTNIYSKMKDRNISKGFGELPFSLKEFHNKFLNNIEFMSFFEIWQNNGYNTKDKPSFDRINPTIGYTFENIQVLPWGENRKKADWEKSFIYTTPVIMYDKNNNIIRDFNSTKEASIMTGITQSLITSCCQGKVKTAKGYVFKYRGDKFRCSKSYDNPELLEVKE